MGQALRFALTLKVTSRRFSSLDTAPADSHHFWKRLGMPGRLSLAFGLAQRGTRIPYRLSLCLEINKMTPEWDPENP